MSRCGWAGTGSSYATPAAVALRDTLIRLTPPRAALRSMARYADWRPPVDAGTPV